MLPAGGIEDPATGSAVGPAGCFAAKYGFVPRESAGVDDVPAGRARAAAEPAPRQGHDDAAATSRAVQVGGASVVVGEGSMSV